MASDMAKRAAHILVEKGGTVGAAMRKAGYSPETAKTPNKLRKTKEYQEIVVPILQKMEKEREAIMDALPLKRKKAGYRDLIDAADKMTKNIQLLSGGRTSNERVSFGWED